MKKKPLFLAVAGAAVLMSLMSGCASSGSASEQTKASDQAAPAPSDSSTPAAGGMPAAAPAADTAPAPAAMPAPTPAPTAAPAPAASTALSDAEVTKRVKAALASHAPTRGLKIGISSNGGVVRLTGTVATSVQIDQIKSVVTDVEGVKEVNNLLKSTHP
jgi:hypothetical protein